MPSVNPAPVIVTSTTEFFGAESGVMPVMVNPSVTVMVTVSATLSVVPSFTVSVAT